MNVQPNQSNQSMQPQMSQTTLYLKGMHGFGDCFHQRGPLRHLLSVYKEVWLESSSVAIYWDLIRDYGLKVINKDSPLRTQKKNAVREISTFYKGDPALEIKGPRIDKQIWYRAKDVKHLGSVLGALCESLGVPLSLGQDFRLPINPSWKRKFDGRNLLQGNVQGKPVLVYRPLVTRMKEWGGCNARNPDAQTYANLFASIREQFYVVSIADVVPGFETICDFSPSPAPFRKADLELHYGQLPMDELAVLFDQAAMVYTSPGFAVPLAQAVTTPVVAVFGGYENSRSFSVGAQWTPYLGIDPINSCQCFMHSHPCDKRIDVPNALDQLRRFASHVSTVNANVTTVRNSNPSSSRTGAPKQTVG